MHPTATATVTAPADADTTELRFTHRHGHHHGEQNSTGITTLTLPLEQRVKARQRVTLDDGRAAGLLLPRGEPLRDGDLLSNDDGEQIRIIAAAEPVSIVSSDDPLLLARACYHLGNRHIALQIAPGQLRYHPDHVLDDMLRHLGLQVAQQLAPFQPEAGAYGPHQH
jgi:urease accessory protein